MREQPWYPVGKSCYCRHRIFERLATRGAFVLGADMLCRDCRWRDTVVRGQVRDHHCKFSGAQVGPYAMGTGSADEDDPERAYCPLTLDDMLDETGQVDLCVGVLTQIGTRGYLPTLLQLYPRRSAELLWHLYLSPA